MIIGNGYYAFEMRPLVSRRPFVASINSTANGSELTHPAIYSSSANSLRCSAHVRGQADLSSRTEFRSLIESPALPTSRNARDVPNAQRPAALSPKRGGGGGGERGGGGGRRRGVERRAGGEGGVGWGAGKGFRLRTRCETYLPDAGRLGAGEGNRTLVCSLGSCRSTIELRPRFAPMISRPRAIRQAVPSICSTSRLKLPLLSIEGASRPRKTLFDVLLPVAPPRAHP